MVGAATITGTVTAKATITATVTAKATITAAATPTEMDRYYEVANESGTTIIIE